jgi:hypothetical protein
VVVTIGIDLGEELATEVVGSGGGEVPRVGEGEFLGGFIPVGGNVRKMFVLMRGPTPETGRIPASAHLTFIR